MDCFTCHKSKWMHEKCLGFLSNLLECYKDHIGDSEVFCPLAFKGADELVVRLVREEFSQEQIEKMKGDCCRYAPSLDLDEDSVEQILYELWNRDEALPKAKAIIRKLVDNAFSMPWNEEDDKDVFHDRMMELQRTLKLSDREIDIMLVSIARREDILKNPGSNKRNYLNNLSMTAKCLNLSEASVMDCISSQKPLRQFECVDNDLDFNSDFVKFLNGLTDDPLASSYFTKDTEETLPWSDFADLAEKHGTILKRMLTASDKPVNILLYGAPGTGKTSFARTLAKEIGRTCYSIIDNSMDKYSCKSLSSPSFRFGALQVCDGQIVPEESLIIVDEADEMLRGNGGFGGLFMLFGGESNYSTGDKGRLNTALDTLKTSTVWITNTPARALDESSRRRFDYSICFEPLNCEQRKRIWKNNIARLKLERLISGRQVEEFSSLYPVSAGGISQTLENLERMHPKRAEVPRLVEQLMKPHCELLCVKLADDKLLPSKDYSLEGLNIQGNVQLERIVEAIRAFQKQKGGKDPDRPRMNLLLSGAPGTGKTEFVKYLGNVLNTKVNVKMGSDLLSMWVGGTEKNIANAFRQAEAEHAILFFDEIDGLVQSRANAQNSWEVTQVNELLHQMENFDGVMIGATNFVKNLDQAIMRRFTFKLHFNFLDDNGKRLFFERMFKSTLTDGELERLYAIPNLAPGDFRTVRQSLFYYGGEITNAQRLDALEREAAAKEGGAFTVRGKLGF